MEYTFDINPRAFKAIKEKNKRVEIRVTKLGDNHFDYSILKPNDMIIFTSDNEKLKCLITEINWYSSIEELLTLEGTKYTLSSTNDYNEGIKSINSFNGYKEAIPINGVYAIHIEPIINTTHDMRLQKEYYDYIQSGTKRIEIRLYDEKRSKININDTIRFHLVDNETEYLDVKVIGLLRYQNIETLISNNDIKLLTRENMPNSELITIFNNIYSKEEQDKYSVLGILFEIIK